MVIRLLLVSLLVMGLAGCATSKKLSKANQIKALHAQVSDLEGELARKNAEIGDLEGKMQSESEGEKYIKKERAETPAPSKKAQKLTHRQIQTALKNAGFYTGAIDGKIGKMTKAAIKEFQMSKGLEADGIVGKKTAAALAEYLDAETK